MSIDAVKRFFLKMVYTGDIQFPAMLRLLLISCLFAAYVFFVYRLLTRKSFYNKSFAVSLAAVSVIVTAIILTVQSSLVVSLGMVGALSIVRFRTAVKEPMDLAFLFWSISIGIIVGAGLPGVALVTSAVLTVGIFLLDRIPVARAPMLLIVSADDRALREKILSAVGAHARAHRVKSQTAETARLDMVVEVRTKDANGLVDAVSSIGGVTRCTLMNHDGETTF